MTGTLRRPLGRTAAVLATLVAQPLALGAKALTRCATTGPVRVTAAPGVPAPE